MPPDRAECVAVSLTMHININTEDDSNDRQEHTINGHDWGSAEDDQVTLHLPGYSSVQGYGRGG